MLRVCFRVPKGVELGTAIPSISYRHRVLMTLVDSKQSTSPFAAFAKFNNSHIPTTSSSSPMNFISFTATNGRRSYSHPQHLSSSTAASHPPELDIQVAGKRGVQITVIGMLSNVGLTVGKGAAGWLMNSASLLADAAHSMSDLLGDFVTLYTFKMSRKRPDTIYPYGYGKYETMGSLAVSSLLVAGAVGIGLHSLHLLVQPSMAASILDPKAAWFAFASVVVKEWLYRATLKIGQTERSSVLIANAWHHRSDALSSGVALVAILGSYAGFPILDPLGGLVVAGMLLRGSADMLTESLQELTDRGLSAKDMSLIQKGTTPHFDILQGRKFGPFVHLEAVLRVPAHISAADVHALQERARADVLKSNEHVQQIHIRLETLSIDNKISK
ncbi:cation efflux family-domain-containing protein [Syncephalastrum racemosum]|uniref:Cation efflux family-domain-containing protein n=1 Tax=Syncephalastrum racemosum TaxID=13706 RepID=A0A1X2HCD2_SYNRA|nr:cation efflux family-domain-containing protein [Syncephalastrum racemosum]